MINSLLSALCYLLGAYFVLDTLWQATTQNTNDRLGYQIKYISALGAGLCVLANYEYTVQVCAVTIALFMLPDTFYRALRWLQYKHTKLHLLVISHLNINFTRRQK